MEGSSSEQLSCSSKENMSGGRGQYCCIPECGSARYDRHKQKTNIGLFKFPVKEKEPVLYKKWVDVISNFRRKGCGDMFSPSSRNNTICEKHFQSNEVRVTFGSSKRKQLVKNAVPSIFSFKTTSVKKRPSPKKRYCSVTVNHKLENTAEGEDSYTEDNVENTMQQVYSNHNQNEHEKINFERTNLLSELNELRAENIFMKEELEKLKLNAFTCDNISRDHTQFKKTVGIDLNTFRYLLNLIDPGENCQYMKFYDERNRKSQDIFERTSDKCKTGPKPKLKSCDGLFITLTWLKNAFSLAHMSWLLNLPVSTISRHLISWINYIYFTLGAIPIWPTQQQIKETMPSSFKRSYPSTRCIIDCTELFCQSPSSLSIQSSLYSQYKSHVTYKGLLGIAPSGAVIFVSQLYDGSISDKEIVRRSGFLKPELWDAGDSVMADRGFTIEDDLESIGVRLNIPAFLGGRDHLTKAEVKESQSIAAVRIHVERAIQRIKKFKTIQNRIPLTLHGSVNQIWTVCCLLTNLLPPLIDEKCSES